MIDLDPFVPEIFTGDTALLVGTGPSLDGFNGWDRYENIVCLNETVLLAPPHATGLLWDADPCERIGQELEKRGTDPHPFMFVVADLPEGRKGKSARWLRPGRYSKFNRLQCKEKGCRIGTAAVAMGVFEVYGITKVDTVGLDAYWWWLIASETASKDLRGSDAPDGPLEASKAVHRILESLVGVPVRRGGRDANYIRISKSLHSAANDRDIELRRA